MVDGITWTPSLSEPDGPPPTASVPLAELKASARGETTCDEPATYLQLAERTRAWDPSIDTIILTSEDPKVVREVLALNHAAKERGEFVWKIIINKGDVMQVRPQRWRPALRHYRHPALCVL
jgi:hypothetical protein